MSETVLLHLRQLLNLDRALADHPAHQRRVTRRALRPELVETVGPLGQIVRPQQTTHGLRARRGLRGLRAPSGCGP